MGHDHTHTHMTDAAETFAMSGHAIVIACPCNHVALALPVGNCTISDATMFIATMRDAIERAIDGLAAAEGVPAEELRMEIGRLLALFRRSKWKGTCERIENQD